MIVMHEKIDSELRDMFGEIKIAKEKLEIKELRNIAERILTMVVKPHCRCMNYNTMTEFDKWLTATYWWEYDNFASVKSGDREEFMKWYVNRATIPDMIARARRWILQEGFIRLKDSVMVQSMNSQDRYQRGLAK